MANFGPLTAEIGSGVWGTPANFNRFRVLAALLHGTLVVGVSQTLRQGGHHVGHSSYIYCSRWMDVVFVMDFYCANLS